MTDEICRNFAIKLKKLRESKNISQGQLSLDADCSKSYIGQIENGQKFPTVKMIAKLSRALGVHIKELFDFEYHLNKDD